MNFFQLTDPSIPPRVARLASIAACDVGEALRRAAVVVRYENAVRNAPSVTNDADRVANERMCGPCLGIDGRCADDSVCNAAKFSLPSDNLYMIASKGEHPHPKGLIQVIDDESINKMVSNFQEEKKNPLFPGILVDREHDSQNGKTESAGWITNLVAKPDGLWANIAWTSEGEKDVLGGVYRLTSPVWKRSDCIDLDKDGRCRPVRLDSLALTNQPNLGHLVPLTKIV